ncbi:MAG: glycosyl hydrolase family 18 protein [Patescibacteria group bacterium]|nr:glycosyl hydrolase family 18 protein [Patescibacteria group bacterium]
MKRVFFIFFTLIFIFSFIFLHQIFLRKNPQPQKNQNSAPSTKPDMTYEVIKGLGQQSKNHKNKQVLEKKAIFVPEWQLDQSKAVKSVESESEDNQLSQLNQYDRLIYFGSERSLTKFIDLIKNSNKKHSLWLTYKIDEVPEKDSWEKIAEEKIKILKDNNFQGLVLDLEIAALNFSNLINQINDFVKFFYSETKKAEIKFSVAVFGDVFYRRRPYDLRFIGENSDEVMIMAYDFSKSYGEPGPNFPFEGRQKFGYDFKTMIGDFLKFVPSQKLTVIFGMFGYQWRADEKKRPISQAKALTLNQIKEKFYLEDNSGQDIISCKLENCLIKRNEKAKEFEINYVISSKTPDEKGFYWLDYYIVWFEDEESVKIKTNYLKEKGIGSIAYWAYNYF